MHMNPASVCCYWVSASSLPPLAPPLSRARLGGGPGSHSSGAAISTASIRRLWALCCMHPRVLSAVVGGQGACYIHVAAAAPTGGAPAVPAERGPEPSHVTCSPTHCFFPDSLLLRERFTVSERRQPRKHEGQTGLQVNAKLQAWAAWPRPSVSWP